jgi:hypothetical protein
MNGENPNPDTPPEPSEIYVPTTREISKLVNFYLKNVRNQPKEEYVGLFRNIMAMCKRGRVSMNDISTALQNYAADEYVQSLDPRLRKSIRVFFKEENILAWLSPMPRNGKKIENSLSVVDRLTSHNQGVNVPIAVTPAKTYEPDPEPDNAL